MKIIYSSSFDQKVQSGNLSMGKAALGSKVRANAHHNNKRLRSGSTKYYNIQYIIL